MQGETQNGGFVGILLTPGLLHLSFKFSATLFCVHYVQRICWHFAVDAVETGLSLWVITIRICAAFIPIPTCIVQTVCLLGTYLNPQSIDESVG